MRRLIGTSRACTHASPTHGRQCWAGDPQAYSVALHNSHYYTADVAVYTHTMVSLFSEFLAHTLGQFPPPVGIPPELRAAVAAQQFDLAHEDTRDTDPSDLAPESST
jgi:hypothetical protein